MTLGPRSVGSYRSLAPIFAMALLLTAVGLIASVEAFDLTVRGSDGATLTTYRWLIQEDTTHQVTPGVRSPETTTSIKFHKSYMPPVASGDETTPPTNLGLSPDKPYFVSVLPKADYQIGGAPIKPGQTAATVLVNKLPVPTASISVFIFEDNHPINNEPDLPQEKGIPEASIILFEAGGRYGISGGQVSQDAFGNPLGTTYKSNGDVDVPGDGTIKTNAAGFAFIKNLHPGKYTIFAVPPPDARGRRWIQTTTIEGGFGIDAWVRSKEPLFFGEDFADPPTVHVFMGFVFPSDDPALFTGNSTITGRVVNLHTVRPPQLTSTLGGPFTHTTPWIGLNDALIGGRGVYAQRANRDGTFSIRNVPPGSYQLVVWDDFLDLIIAFQPVEVSADGDTVALGDVGVFNWFGALHNYVFYDANQDGFRDPSEPGIANQTINIRFRDGSLFQSGTTDNSGFVAFEEIFPFFAWQVAEVDYARFKATGFTVVVDGGGTIDSANPWSFGGRLNPQIQANRLPYRVETGPVGSALLLEAFQIMSGQTNVLLWGKKDYAPGENGGVVGIVYYAVTRAEDDPRLSAPEPWEPGIPRVRINLYKTDAADPKNRANWVLINAVTTDSWDDNIPTGCVGPPFRLQGVRTDCFDGLRNFNQMRPGVFDGGYAFQTYFTPSYGARGAREVFGLPAGPYIVEVVVPPGYELVKEEDKNVDFGDRYIPADGVQSLQAGSRQALGAGSTPVLLPECVGDLRVVPNELSLFPGVPAKFAGELRPLCDKKLVWLNEGQQVNGDFHLFTSVPVAGQIYGVVTDDINNEFSRRSPLAGEKFGPAFMPISIRDWTGQEIDRVYTDQFGAFNLLVPSTYTINPPIPSGVSPNMLTVCVNDKTRPDPNSTGRFVAEPFFNSKYGTFCYPFQSMPGTTTYLDTPVLPTSAFAGSEQFPLDCEFISRTPVIASVDNPVERGPYVTALNRRLRITSAGREVEVANPRFNRSNSKTVKRDYGFGADRGIVTIGGAPLTIVSWAAEAIEVEVPAGVRTGQLIVTRASGESTVVGITVTVRQAGDTFAVRHVGPGGSIQAAIDVAAPGELILVAPGTYHELVLLWKRVRLQGWGAYSTTIDAQRTAISGKLTAWRQKLLGLIDTNQVDLLPGQAAILDRELLFPGIPDQGSGIFVILKQGTQGPIAIDGFTITGASAGAIVVNGYASGLEISNNRILNNLGVFSGAIRLGDPRLATVEGGKRIYQSAFNDDVRIHHNHIAQNSGRRAGGGIGLFAGSDSYQVTLNFICGNLALNEGGGGIAHLGLSPLGRIAHNTILFNESYAEIGTAGGGGILISGQPGLDGTLSPGSGSVDVVANLIQGNVASSGDGGGIELRRVNGGDLIGISSPVHTIGIYNNMLVNNIAGLAGAGVGLQDALVVNIVHNTIAHNDSTATAAAAFPPGNANRSTKQPSGIVSRVHTAALAAALANPGIASASPAYSNPVLTNNIIWENRSFYFDTTDGLIPNVAGGDLPVFIDLGVVGAGPASQLDPRSSVLTNRRGFDASNVTTPPRFIASYFNGARGFDLTLDDVKPGLETGVAFDEGGNMTRIRFGPLTQTRPRIQSRIQFGPLTQTRPDSSALFGNYHLSAGRVGDPSALGLSMELMNDFDGVPRSPARPIRGADQPPLNRGKQ